MSRRRFCVDRYLITVFLVVFALFWVGRAYAQEPGGDMAIGGQIGDPSGFSFKTYQKRGMAYEFLATWNLADYYFFSFHSAFEQPFEESALHYYWGPGVALGIENKSGDTRSEIAVSANVGVNFFTGKFEVFIQMTPRLTLLPDTKGNIGGGVGLRYYVH